MTELLFRNLIERLDRIETKLDKRVLKEWMSISDVIQATGNSKSTINRAIKKGTLKSVLNGGKRMFRKSWVDKWISG
ncbi:MAG: helix-turn-helix domain-containing protein [Candidatus Marinimicrobia bacterium]|jgi:excisionase family DNA binding protein|nr:helix-turn-helix domain-containing protein [Candidatus Neomarinimicrobiota bacterium]